MKQLLLVVLCFAHVILSAQVSEDFSDNEFLNSPAWFGDVTNFEILSQELHLIAPAVEGISYLATTSESINNATWEFRVRLDFNPSSSNYAKFYLVSDSANLAGPLHGYFVRIGGSSDDISLIKQNGLVETILIDGLDGSINTSAVDVSVKVTRDDQGNWELFSDIGTTGVYFSEGVVQENDFARSFYCGLMCKYTSTRSDKFYLDNITISGVPYIDLFPPMLANYSVLNENSLMLVFNEPLLPGTVLPENFVLNSQLPIQIVFDSDNSSKVNLTFGEAFTNGFNHQLFVQGISDNFNNVIEPFQLDFLYFVEIPAGKGDVVINEIFPDPSPAIELPEAEFIELYNTSTNPFQLAGWQITDGSTLTTLGSFLLLPDSMLIICPTAYVSQYAGFGYVLGASPWPSQNNTGDFLIIRDAAGVVIDSVYYSNSWYGDENKDDGGYTLERINPVLNCYNQSNWKASESESGGTPGSQNSVFNLEEDEIAPSVVQASFIAPNLLELILDEPVVEQTIPHLTFTLTPEIETDSIIYLNDNPSFRIYLADSIPNESPYHVYISGVADCSGNTLDDEFTLQLDFLPPAILDVQIHHYNELEVSFNEPPAASSISKNNFYLEDIVPAKVTVIDSVHAVLSFDQELIDLQSYTLSFQNLKDIEGNAGGGSFNFIYTAPPEPGFLELIITEIMVDPEPGLGTLPVSQYVEIFNTSSKKFSLKGLQLGDLNSTAISNAGILDPLSYILLVPSTQKINFPDGNKIIGLTNWPSLNNTGEIMSIKNRKGGLLHQIEYSNKWYKELEKQEGGWSLEMIDTNNPCGEAANWGASISDIGGTPGLVNSLLAENPDNFGPMLTSVIPIDSVTLFLEFNEPIHANKLPGLSISPEIAIQSLKFKENSFTKILVKLEAPLSEKVSYHIIIQAADCKGNVSSIESDEFYLPEESVYNDIVISEILFNPFTGGIDFVEFFNRSDKHLLLSDWTSYSYTQSGKTGSEIITSDYFILKPKAYLIISEDKLIFSNLYPFVDLNKVIEMNLPTLPDEEGTLVLRNTHNIVVDSVYYNEDWHHPLLKSKEGVSLERRSPDISSVDPNNWKSASSTVSFSTPASENSQSYNPVPDDSEVDVFPKLFFPGTGGTDSFATIEYSLGNPNLLASINIFAGNGLLVKRIAVNQLLATEGIFTWDGADDSGNKVTLGHYFVVFDVFSPDGYKKRYRKKVAVGVR